MTKTDATLKSNLDRLEPLLAKLKAQPIAHAIGGERPAVQATFETHSPTDKSVIARVARGTAADIDKAAQAAKKAFKSWAAFDPDKRREMIQRANGRSTFPQIFVGEEHIGGCDDMMALEHAGKLDPLLAA